MWYKRKAAQAVDVVVLIEAGGASFSKFRGHPWTARIRADRWRDSDGLLSNEPFDAEMAVDGLSDEQISAWSEDWYRVASELTVVRLSGSWGEEKPGGRTMILRELPEPAQDAELAAIAAALKRPVVIPNESFGDFTLSRTVGWFAAEPTWRGRVVGVTVAATRDDKIDPDALARTEALWADIERWYGRYVDCAVEHLLDLKNDGWLDDDEAPITATEFAARIHLSSISVEDDDAVVFFDDGDLFFGHTIIVSGPLATGPQDAQIAG